MKKTLLSLILGALLASPFTGAFVLANDDSDKPKKPEGISRPCFEAMTAAKAGKSAGECKTALNALKDDDACRYKKGKGKKKISKEEYNEKFSAAIHASCPAAEPASEEETKSTTSTEGDEKPSPSKKKKKAAVVSEEESK